MGNNKNKQDLYNPAPNESLTNSEEPPTLDQSAKDKFSYTKFLKEISSKLPFLSIAFWGLSVVSIFAVVFLALALLHDTLSSKKDVKNISDFASAKSEFESRTSVDKAWFQEGIKLPDTLLFVNTNKDSNGNRRFIYIINGNRDELSFTNIAGTNNAGKHIIENDTSKFDEFTRQFFSIEAIDDINSVANKIGADNIYIKDIEIKYPQIIKKQRDVIFSLIYNTIVGDVKGHIAVTIENRKLKIITVNDFVWDRIDAGQFLKSMKWIASNDTLAKKDKFVLASSGKLLNAQQNMIFDNTENIFNQYFNNDKIIQQNQKLPINFLYYNFRKNVLHIGINEFSIDDIKTKQYLPRLKSFPENVFYLVENDTTLYDFSNFNAKTNTILWGKIDAEKLANGKFKTDDFVSGYGIIKTWDKAYLLYLALFILLIQILLSVYYWDIKHKKQLPKSIETEAEIEKETKTEKETPKTEDIVIAETALPKDQKAAVDSLKKQIEDYNKAFEQQKENYKIQLNAKSDEIKKQEEENTALAKENGKLKAENAELNIRVGNALVDFQGLPATGKDCVVAILKAFDKALKGNSIKEFERLIKVEIEESIIKFKKNENFDIIKKQSNFYDKIINTKKESDLLNQLDELRKKVKYLPEIKSLKKIYNDLVIEKKGQKDEIITAFLNQIDDYAKDKELLPQFNKYKHQTEKYQQIKPTLDATQKQVSDFYSLCLKLQKKDTPDFWDRTALSVWAISQLAIPLLKTWQKQIWFAEKPDNITEALKSDLLQIYTTRYFLRDTNESKLIEDFTTALDKEIPQKIAEYNAYISQEANAKLNSVDTNLKNQLTAILWKIKKFDSTQEFNDKMWDNFVRDFLQKAPNIKSDEDKAWFFAQLFNITYHTADYLDFIKNNRNIIYCFNYQLLHNNFDLSKTDHYDFQLNHIEKSTTYSNLIYKWADDLKIKQLKVLIGKYMIKP